MIDKTEIQCHRCNERVIPVLDKTPLINGIPRIKASCPICGRYIKNLPTGAAPRFYFGKYKGELIADIAASDPSYCRYMLTLPLKPKILANIQSALEAIQ